MEENEQVVLSRHYQISCCDPKSTDWYYVGGKHESFDIAKRFAREYVKDGRKRRRVCVTEVIATSRPVFRVHENKKQLVEVVLF